MNVNLAGYMAFIVYMNAAITDADELRRVQLRKEIRPLLDEWQHNPKIFPVIITKIQEIMGDEWVMEEEHKRSIEQLLDIESKEREK